MVLNELPSTDLVVLSRVNRTWRATIRDSSHLREKLFLKEATGPARPSMWNDLGVITRRPKSIWYPIDAAKLEKISAAGNPWRNMFVSQPPKTRMSVLQVASWPHVHDCIWKRMDNGLCGPGDCTTPVQLDVERVVANERGVTFADLWKARRTRMPLQELYGRPAKVQLMV